ncbi:leucine-rich repeat and death domain-containing protein 1-like isoform X2 [Dysidea avara]
MNEKIEALISPIKSVPPQLPRIITHRHITLNRKSSSSELGFIVRGTTTEFPDNNKVYTCAVDSITEGGLADVVGLETGDQILSINGMEVRDCGHKHVIQLFKEQESLNLTVLPNRYRDSKTVRITLINSGYLSYLWSLSRCLDTLEITNIKLEEREYFTLAGLYNLKSLTLSHCILSSINCLKTLSIPKRLRVLNLSHNQLTGESLHRDCALVELTSLVKLDLSHNHLETAPLVLTKLTRLVALILVNNMISQLPDHLRMVRSLRTLCLDGNCLEEIDSVVSGMPNLQKISVSNNFMETEAYSLRFGEFKAIALHSNPYSDTRLQSKCIIRRKPSFKNRAVSVKGTFLRHSMSRMSLCLCLDGPSFKQTEKPPDKLPTAKSLTLGHSASFSLFTQ